jgi:hypothetical protein
MRHSAKTLLMVLVVIISVQAKIVHQRDTLHILKTQGVGCFLTNTQVYDTERVVSTENYSAPCATKSYCAFFGIAGNPPACPCCASWSLGSTRPFYEAWGRASDIDWSVPLDFMI